MKLFISAALASVLLLGACDSTNPFIDEEETTGTNTDGDGDTDTDGDGNTDNTFNIAGGGVPAGVDGPAATSNEQLIRYEELNDDGGGRAEEFEYDSATDQFSVSNLAFDGDGPYTRETAASIASLGPNESYALYEAEQVVPDFLDGDAVGQIVPYRAIVGVSNATASSVDAAGVTTTVPRTSFAIVRTGGYINYGFGGFVYQRQGGVVMPTTGQARFDGDYAGIRIFDDRGGLEYVEADMQLFMDFDDPTDAVAGVRGSIFNRVAYDINGNVINSTGPGQVTNVGQLPLPNISFVLDGDNGNASLDGELTGGLATNTYLDPNGEEITHESGTYYAILAGDATAPDGGEVVGIAVITSIDPRTDSPTQETGGFILYRDESYVP